MAAELWPETVAFERANVATVARAWLLGRALDILLEATCRIVELKLGIQEGAGARAAERRLLDELEDLGFTGNAKLSKSKLAQIHNALGLCRIDVDPESALIEFRAADPDREASFGAASCLIKLGRYQEAEALYSRISKRLRRQGNYLDSARAGAGIHIARWHQEREQDRGTQSAVRGTLAAIQQFEMNLPAGADPLTLYTVKRDMQGAYVVVVAGLARKPELSEDEGNLLIGAIWALLGPELLMTPRAAVGPEPWSSMLAKLQRPLGAMRAALASFPGVGVIHAFPGVGEIILVVYGYDRKRSFRFETSVLSAEAAAAARQFHEVMNQQLGADLCLDQIRVAQLNARLASLGDQIGAALEPAFVEALRGMDELYTMPNYEANLDWFPIAGLRLGGEWLGHTHAVVRSPTPNHLRTVLSPNRPRPRPNGRAAVGIGEVVLGDSKIQAASAEAARFCRVAESIGFECEVTEKPSIADMRRWLGGGVGLLHYIGHGISTNIYEGLPLATGQTLRATDLDALEAMPSFVSLCACEMARSRGGPGGFHVGLASGLVELGASGVVAFSMPLPESRAYDAIVAFYRETRHYPIGRATSLSYRKISATTPAYVWLSLICYGDARFQLPSLTAGGEPMSSVTDSWSWTTVLRDHAVVRTEDSLAKALAAAHKAPETLRDGLYELVSAFRRGFDSKLASTMSLLEEQLLLENGLSDAERLSIRLLVGLGRAHSAGIDAQPVRWPAADSEATVLHNELELVAEGAAAIYDWGLCGLAPMPLS